MDRIYCPDYCCVPAFVFNGLLWVGFKGLTLEKITKELDIGVAPNTKNDWNLRVEEDEYLRGIKSSDAIIRINSLFRKEGLNKYFRHIRLNEISLGLYTDVINEAIEKRIFIGIGYNLARLKGIKGSIRHLSTIKSLVDDRIIELAENCLNEFIDCRKVKWDELEKACLDENDGLWLIGDKNIFELNHTINEYNRSKIND
jgi:hypothetical protein